MDEVLIGRIKSCSSDGVQGVSQKSITLKVRWELGDGPGKVEGLRGRSGAVRCLSGTLRLGPCVTHFSRYLLWDYVAFLPSTDSYYWLSDIFLPPK